jgi:hypothetical protein
MQMNGSNNYVDRNSRPNVGELFFEEYCHAKGYFIRRLGFDEKNNPVPSFFNINACIRNLPDYYVENKDGSKLVMVKGTGNIKQKEYELMPQFALWYDSVKCPLVYAFCFTDKKPLLFTLDQVTSLYEQSTDKQWPDGVTYRNLNI